MDSVFSYLPVHYCYSTHPLEKANCQNGLASPERLRSVTPLRRSDCLHWRTTNTRSAMCSSVGPNPSVNIIGYPVFLHTVGPNRTASHVSFWGTMCSLTGPQPCVPSRDHNRYQRYKRSQPLHSGENRERVRVSRIRNWESSWQYAGGARCVRTNISKCQTAHISPQLRSLKKI